MLKLHELQEQQQRDAENLLVAKHENGMISTDDDET